jgi:acetyl-CoA carboxylase biotin carboxyl carrier protein
MSEQKVQELAYSLTYRDVVEILRLVNGSPHLVALELQLGDLKVSVSRVADGLPPPIARTGLGSPSAIAAESVEVDEEQREMSEAAASLQTGGELVAVRAPMLGTFYRAPAPGEPPYVEPGDLVEVDDPIGLIDVMKLFSQISAGVAGRVVEILAQNGTLVEHGQPLVLIEPLPSAV